MESILETIPMIQNVADIETVQLFNVDSNEMDEGQEPLIYTPVFPV